MAEEQEDEVEVEHEEEVEAEVVDEDQVFKKDDENGEQRKRLRTLEEKVKLLEKELMRARRDNCELRQENKAKDGKMRRWMALGEHPQGGGGDRQRGRGGGGRPMEMVREAKNALEVLPLEIWGEIFNHLVDSQDFENCYRASSAWNPVLKPKKTTFLFPKVLPILAKNQSFLPNRANMGELRLVCHAWKHAVDRYLQNHECHFNLNEYCQQDDDHECWRRRLRFCFVTSHGVNDFRTDMLQNYKGPNPFITRSVTFVDPHSGRLHESDQLWTSVISLLSLVGEEIWFCNLCVFADQSPETFYKIVGRCLRRMPNIKVLELGFNNSSTQESSSSSSQLSEVVEMNPFPKMGNLSVLITNQLPQQILNECLNKSSQIKKLQVEKQPNSSFDESIKLDHLVELTISINSMEDVSKLGLIPWRLRTLSLVVLCNQYENLSQLFQTLSHFGPTLKNLNLKFDRGSSTTSSSRVGGRREDAPPDTSKLVLNTANQKLRLHLPHLEKLRIHVANVELKDIDFILPLQNLQKLILVLDHHDGRNEAAEVRPCPEDKDAVIRFFGILDHLYDSNIWKLCPYLKSVFLKIRSDRNYWRFFRRFLYIRENYIDMDIDPE
ncbi:unnamed protein product [Orchesella dallaii]|uniref:F-box domain-containing protein n=1 Tax=Orchesella dallaii TaxID=48710 RepID=A0ABP1RGH5_9HEXA